MERKKTSLMILGVCALVLSIIGVTYAFWQLRLQQTDENNLTTSCFDIELIDEKNAIKLEKAYPILDEEGEKLTPYTFTLRNNCNANVKYQINLESLAKLNSGEDVTERLDEKYLKVKLNEVGKEGSIQELTEENKVEATLIDGQTEGKARSDKAYKLKTGYIAADEKTKTFELRLWLKGELTMEDEEAMNKTYASKITVVATYAKEAKKTLVDTVLAIEPQENNSGASGIYKVTHDDAEITYTQDPAIIAKLKQDEYRYAGSNPNNYVSFGEKVAEDKFELIGCIGDMCVDAHMMGLEKSAFSTQEQCDIEISKYQEIVESEGVILSCKQTESAGDPIYWRIIGLVNTPEGQRVKLIRETSIGVYSWDTSEENLNDGYGVNEWSQSDLMKLLNPGYKGNQNQSCTWNEELGLICYFFK